MKGSFFAGIALGALIGAMMLDVNPQTEDLVDKGKNAIEKQVRKMSE